VWDIQVSGNFNWNDGANRTRSINGPGAVYGGTTGTITKNTLAFENTGSYRLDAVKLLDLGFQKSFAFSGGRYRIKGMFDIFNIFNVNDVQGWNSGNLSSSNFLVPTSIVPPRVMRVGAQITF
jgi:hypothetical protein